MQEKLQKENLSLNLGHKPCLDYDHNEPLGTNGSFAGCRTKAINVQLQVVVPYVKKWHWYLEPAEAAVAAGAASCRR